MVFALRANQMGPFQVPFPDLKDDDVAVQFARGRSGICDCSEVGRPTHPGQPEHPFGKSERQGRHQLWSRKGVMSPRPSYLRRLHSGHSRLRSAPGTQSASLT